MQDKKSKKTIEDLNQIYSKAESCDKEIFAEQRSNVLLISGEHYTNKNNRFDRIRDSKDIASGTKLKLTKNHIQKITKTYVNNIVEAAPGVKIIPRNESDLHHQKSAELNQSVWQFGKDTQKLDLRIMEWAKDYIDLGECFVKVYYDPSKGKFKGYLQATHPETGEPQVDEQGQLVADKEQPQFSGELVIEKLLPCNVLRDENAQNMDESPFIIVRKMVPIKTLEQMVGDDADKKKMIQPSSREEYMVFDMANQGYQTTKDLALVKEYYFRPGPEFPLGYFFITTEAGILFEGELPFGIFPIKYVGFDAMQTSPRHRSIVKQLRPYQIEINRTASKIAEHQVTSDDKLMVQTGTKISSGGVLPGVRTVQYSGIKPEILEGRTGEQYLPYMMSQIDEIYKVANMAEEIEDKQYQADPFGMLFRSVKDKKKFVIYSAKFELFLKEVCLLYLSLAKQYFSDDMLIPMIGKNEVVNIAELRGTDDVQFSVEVKPMSDDVNTMMGKSLAINHALQYVGPQMSKDQIGQMLREMPFANFDGAFDDMTLDYDSATNVILSLDRGEQVVPSKGDNKDYMIKRLDKRIRSADFKLLPGPVQQSFLQIKGVYEQMVQQELKELQAAQQGFIPTGGALIKTDLQVELPNSVGGMKITRAAYPIEALQWLDERLKQQGMAQDRLQGEVSQAEMNSIMQGVGGTGAGMPNQGAPGTAPAGPPQGPMQGGPPGHGAQAMSFEEKLAAG
jgi:hypothetical protein